MTEKVILDCDPGHDDVFAILLAAGNPNIDLLAITTVGGNQILEKVTRNALAVCEIAGIDGIPVAAGAQYPLVRPPRIADNIHGESGLDGPELPKTDRTPDPRHAVDVIIDIVMSNDPGTVNLVPTGPLTNIALAMRKEPRIIERVKRVTLMGGSYTRGNTTPAAEFNILVDPEAANAVFAGNWPVTMIGLDATHQATADPQYVEKIAAIGSPLSKFCVELLDFFRSTCNASFGWEYPPVHDPLCPAYLIDPTVVGTEDAFVTVELAGTWTVGMTVTDFRNAYGQPHNTQVATTVDNPRFWEMVTKAVATLSERTAS